MKKTTPFNEALSPTLPRKRGRGLVILLILLAGLAPAASFASSLPEPLPAGAARADEILVRYQSAPSPQALAAEAKRLAATSTQPQALHSLLLAQEGVSTIARIDRFDVERLRVPAGRKREDVISHLRASSLVLYSEPNYLRRAAAVFNDPDYNLQWWLQQIHGAQAYNVVTTTARNQVIIAIVDTGIRLSHEDLVDQLVPPGLRADFINSGGGGADDEGHGTHVSGIAAATINNSFGIAGTAGVPNIRLMPVKVLDFSGTGDDFTIANGITWAVDHGARVINLSLGAESAGQVLQDAVTYARQQNCLVVAAGGNNAQIGNGNFYPAAYPSVVAVAASDNLGGRSLYSNFGSYIDIAAPGGNTFNADHTDEIFSTTINNNSSYDYKAGTSMASPVVAGVAALLFAQGPSRTPDQVENILETTTEKTGNDPYANGWNPYLGWGRVDIFNALSRSTTFTSSANTHPSYNYPNPFAPGLGQITNILVPLSTGQTVQDIRLRIFDAMGRLVRTLEVSPGQIFPGGTIAWDGKNDGGHPVANGIYPYRLELNGTMYQNKIAVKN